MNVLILDDDVDVRRMISHVILEMDFNVLQAGKILEAHKQLDSADIAIVDINLPDGNGYEFANTARTLKPEIGIIMLTVRSAVEDVVRGYNEGADIYLAKPFSASELTAILYSLARRNQLLTAKPATNHWTLNVFGRYIITPTGLKAELTERETLFFELIAKSQRNLVSKRHFVESIGYNWVDFDNRRFDTFISRLKKRIKQQTLTTINLKADRQGNYYLMDMLDLQNH